MQGYIKDYRKEIESDVWLMPPLYHRTWQWMKYMVNHEENDIPMRDGTTLHIKRGQHLTSIRDIAKAIGWYEGVRWKEPNPKTVSTILDWMVKQGMIVIHSGKGNRQYTLFTLLNWEFYNPKKDEGNSKVTPRGTDREHLADINNNDLNVFNDLEFKRTTTITEIEEPEELGSYQKQMKDLIETYGRELFDTAFKEAMENNDAGIKNITRLLQRYKIGA